eukprot:scaffold32636_cov63-Phaeocystis_antarctica.AAC.2
MSRPGRWPCRAGSGLRRWRRASHLGTSRCAVAAAAAAPAPPAAAHRYSRVCPRRGSTGSLGGAASC